MPPPAFDPTGTWRHERVITSTATLPNVGEVQRTVTIKALWAIAAEGPKLFATETLCSVEATSVPRLDVRSVPGFMKAASGARYEVAVVPTLDGLRFEASGAAILGARLPRADAALPDKAGDPAVTDFDGDGHPGVTWTVKGPPSGEVWRVERTSFNLEGRVLQEKKQTSVSGEGTTLFERQVLSPPNPALDPLASEQVTGTQFSLVLAKSGAKCPR